MNEADQVHEWLMKRYDANRRNLPFGTVHVQPIMQLKPANDAGEPYIANYSDSICEQCWLRCGMSYINDFVFGTHDRCEHVQ